jgi:hypothetical protein
MSESQMRTAFGRSFKRRDSGLDGCISLTDLSGGVTFVLQHDKLRLIEIRTSGIATRSGLEVGMPFEKVKQTFGQELHIGTNFYDDSTIEAIVWEADHGHGVLFEAREGRITALKSGDKALEWVEGCGV